MISPSTLELFAWAGLAVWCIGSLAFILIGFASERRAHRESETALADQDESDRKPGDGF